MFACDHTNDVMAADIWLLVSRWYGSTSLQQENYQNVFNNVNVFVKLYLHSSNRNLSHAKIFLSDPNR